MKYLKKYENFLSQLSYSEVVTKIRLERPIKDYIQQKYPHIKIPENNTFSKTSLNKILKLVKTSKDIKLKKLVDKYLDYLKEMEIKYDSQKYNL